MNSQKRRATSPKECFKMYKQGKFWVTSLAGIGAVVITLFAASDSAFLSDNNFIPFSIGQVSASVVNQQKINLSDNAVTGNGGWSSNDRQPGSFIDPDTTDYETILSLRHANSPQNQYVIFERQKTTGIYYMAVLDQSSNTVDSSTRVLLSDNKTVQNIVPRYDPSSNTISILSGTSNNSLYVKYIWIGPIGNESFSNVGVLAKRKLPTTKQVTVNYQDSRGNKLIPSIKQDGFSDSESYQVSGDTPTIPNATYKSTTGSTKGIISDSENSVTYIYSTNAATPTINGIKDTDKNITGTGTPGDTITIFDSKGVEIGTTTISNDGTWQYSIESQSLRPNTTISVQSSNKNTDAPSSKVEAPVSYDSDGHQPKINQVKNTDKVIKGTGIPGDTVSITDASGSVIGTGIVEADGTYSINSNRTLNPNEVLNAQATDKLGNKSSRNQTTVQFDQADFDNKKDLAKADIDAEVKKVKSEIDNDPSLTTDEKNAQKALVDQAAQNAKNNIEQQTSYDGLSNATADGIKDIDSKYNTGDLDKKKSDTINNVQNDADNQKKIVDADKGLTTDEKEAQKSKIDTALKNAINNINSATNADAVVLAGKNGQQDIEAQYQSGDLDKKKQIGGDLVDAESNKVKKDIDNDPTLTADEKAIVSG